jgi:hypothetical protein
MADSRKPCGIVRKSVSFLEMKTEVSQVKYGIVLVVKWEQLKNELQFALLVRVVSHLKHFQGEFLQLTPLPFAQLLFPGPVIDRRCGRF